MMKNNRQTITLSPVERRTLTSLNVREESAFDFWQAVLRDRGFRCPQDKVFRITPAQDHYSPTEFTITLESKKLGPQAIASAARFNSIADAKVQKFELFVPIPRQYAQHRWQKGQPSNV